MTNTKHVAGARAREVYLGGDWNSQPDGCGASLLPEMPMLGWSRWDEAQVHGLRPHRHETHEICLIVDGQVTWWVQNSEGVAEAVTLGRGDVFLTLPHEPHGGADTLMHPCELFWLHVDLPQLLGTAGREACAGVALHAAFAMSSPRRFRASAAVRDGFETLLREHRAPTELARLAARAALLGLLVGVARDRSRVPSPAPLSPEIAAALCWMRAHLGESFCVQAAADAAHLTPSRFHERFLAELGQTPGEWRIRTRVAAAEKRLRQSEETVTEISLALGFASSQHFATAFKRYTGLTPTAFRRRGQAGRSAEEQV